MTASDHVHDQSYWPTIFTCRIETSHLLNAYTIYVHVREYSHSEIKKSYPCGFYVFYVNKRPQNLLNFQWIKKNGEWR